MLAQFVLKNRITRNSVFAASMLVLGSACSHVTSVNQGMLKEHTQLRMLDAYALANVNAMNKEAGPDYFNSPSNFETVNGFMIFFQEGRNEILVTRNGKVVAKIDDESLTAYKDVLEAPSIGTERVEVFPRGIVYNGDVFTINDFDFDGADVKYKTTNPEGAQSLIGEDICQRLVTLAPGVACCQENSDGRLIGYVFDITSGWKRNIENATLAKRCEGIQ